MVMDAVRVAVVADGAMDHATGAMVPVASVEDEAVVLVVAAQEDFNFVRNATLSKRELYDYLCAVANFSLFILHS